MTWYCFCLCYENLILSYGDKISWNSNISRARYIIHSLQFPLFIVFFFETSKPDSSDSFTFHLMKATKPDELSRVFPFGLSELFAFILFCLSLLVDFGLLTDDPRDTTPKAAGRASYKYLAEHSESGTVWLSLVPSIVLSLFDILVSFAIYRLREGRRKEDEPLVLYNSLLFKQLFLKYPIFHNFPK